MQIPSLNPGLYSNPHLRRSKIISFFGEQDPNWVHRLKETPLKYSGYNRLSYKQLGNVLKEALAWNKSMGIARYKELMFILNKHRQRPFDPKLVYDGPHWKYLPLLRTASFLCDSPAYRITIRWVMFTLRSNLILQTRGQRYYFWWRKEIWTDFVRHVTSSQNASKLSPWVKRNTRGLPAVAGVESFLPKIVYPLDDHSVKRIRLFLSLLKSYDILLTVPKMDLSSIVSPPVVSPEPTFFGDRGINLREIFDLPYFPFHLGEELPDDGWFISNSSGPNCDLAPAGHREDLTALALDRPVFNNVLNLALRLGLTNICQIMRQYRFKETLNPRIPLQEAESFLKTRKRPLLHSLNIAIPDKGGKTRVIAILDIYSQSVLQPVHKYFMKCLRSIGTDSTYDQQSGRLRVLNAARSGRVLYSFDLSNATDRLPTWAIHSALSVWCDPRFVSLFLSVMCERNFHHIEWKPDKRKFIASEPYRYSVGTPMGALGSFPAGLALPHHAIVQACAKEVGRDLPFTDYAVLGDDIVLWDSTVARRYRSHMVTTFGVVISEAKSIMGIRCAEFGKMIISQSEVITPLPWRLTSVSSDARGFALSLLSDLCSRWVSGSFSLRTLIRVAPRGWEALLCPLFTRVWVDTTRPSAVRWLAKYESKLFDISVEDKIKLLFEVTLGDFSHLFRNWKEMRDTFLKDKSPIQEDEYQAFMRAMDTEVLREGLTPWRSVVDKATTFIREVTDLSTEIDKKLGYFLESPGELELLEFREWLLDLRTTLGSLNRADFIKLTRKERSLIRETRDSIPLEVLSNASDYYGRFNVELPPIGVYISVIGRESREHLLALRRASELPALDENPGDRSVDPSK